MLRRLTSDKREADGKPRELRGFRRAGWPEGSPKGACLLPQAAQVSSLRHCKRRGFSLIELMAVIVVAAALILIGALSVYRGMVTSQELTCKDNMRAIHSALQIYWEKNRDPVTQEHIYPRDQAAFEQFLGDGAYFPHELRCPRDRDNAYHYQYSYNPSTKPGPEGIVITCPVAESGHGSIP